MAFAGHSHAPSGLEGFLKGINKGALCIRARFRVDVGHAMITVLHVQCCGVRDVHPGP